VARCVDCSDDRKQLDVGVKLSQAYLDESQYEESFSVCERLMESLCSSDEDAALLSLSRVMASAAAASPLVCTDRRRLLVGSFFVLIILLYTTLAVLMVKFFS